MTENQRNEILEQLRNRGFANCRYRPSDGHFFMCTAGRKGKRYREYFLKEKDGRIGFWGSDYEIMRTWADSVIAPAFTVNGWVYGRKKNDRPNHEDAIWFNLVNKSMNEKAVSWFAQRQTVIDVAVRLYKKLKEHGIFAEGFNAENFRKGEAQRVDGIKEMAKQVGIENIPQLPSNVNNLDVTNKHRATSAKFDELIPPVAQTMWPESYGGVTMTQYWRDYYDFWDSFVRQWFENNACPTNDVTRWYRSCVANLNLDELPEPYLGTPHGKVKAVFINLNPGGSLGDLEGTKFYSNRMDEQRGWLIREFMKMQCSYRKFIDNWSALIPKLKRYNPEVCGVDWWQGVDRKLVGGSSKRGRQIRMNWVCQIYGKTKSADETNSSEGEISSLDVFALELCPFHSVKFKGLAEKPGKKEILDFIRDWVIYPASHAVAEKGLDFAIAAGGMKNGNGTLTDIFDAICGMPEKVWSYEQSPYGWPLNGKGSPMQRKYVLYKVSNDKPARILVTMMEGGNKAPSKNFNEIEVQIRTYCKDNPL